MSGATLSLRRLTTTEELDHAHVDNIAYSPDGRRIAAGCSVDSCSGLFVIMGQDLSTVQETPGFPGEWDSLDYSPCGGRLAAGSGGQCHVFETSQGRVL